MPTNARRARTAHSGAGVWVGSDDCKSLACLLATREAGLPCVLPLGVGTPEAGNSSNTARAFKRGWAAGQDDARWKENPFAFYYENVRT